MIPILPSSTQTPELKIWEDSVDVDNIRYIACQTGIFQVYYRLDTTEIKYRRLV
jgi:hypothetical protein